MDKHKIYFSDDEDDNLIENNDLVQEEELKQQQEEEKAEENYLQEFNKKISSQQNLLFDFTNMTKATSSTKKIIPEKSGANVFDFKAIIKKKSKLNLMEFTKKIEDEIEAAKPKKFISKRVTEKNKSTIICEKVIEYKRQFEPRLPPYNFVNKDNKY